MNQHQLMALAIQHRAHPQVKSLIAEVQMAWCDVHAARIALQLHLTPIDEALKNVEGIMGVGQSNTGLVEPAAKLASKLDRVAHCYLMLAGTLQSLGLKIDY